MTVLFQLMMQLPTMFLSGAGGMEGNEGHGSSPGKITGGLPTSRLIRPLLPDGFQTLMSQPGKERVQSL